MAINLCMANPSTHDLITQSNTFSGKTFLCQQPISSCQTSSLIVCRIFPSAVMLLDAGHYSACPTTGFLILQVLLSTQQIQNNCQNAPKKEMVEPKSADQPFHFAKALGIARQPVFITDNPKVIKGSNILLYFFLT